MDDTFCVDQTFVGLNKRSSPLSKRLGFFTPQFPLPLKRSFREADVVREDGSRRSRDPSQLLLFIVLPTCWGVFRYRAFPAGYEPTLFCPFAANKIARMIEFRVDLS